MRSESAAMPNMRRNVRLRWDESEKPAPWAASVRDAPAEKSSRALVRRSQQRALQRPAQPSLGIDEQVGDDALGLESVLGVRRNRRSAASHLLNTQPRWAQTEWTRLRAIRTVSEMELEFIARHG